MYLRAVGHRFTQMNAYFLLMWTAKGVIASFASGTWPDRGQPGLKAGWAWLVAGLWPRWPGDKKTGEAAATRPARPGLAAVGRGQNWEGKAKNINMSAWPEQAAAGQGKNWQSLPRKSRKVWPTIGLHWLWLAGPKIGQACQETLTSLAKIVITRHVYLFRVYLEWSVRDGTRIFQSGSLDPQVQSNWGPKHFRWVPKSWWPSPKKFFLLLLWERVTGKLLSYC